MHIGCSTYVWVYNFLLAGMDRDKIYICQVTAKDYIVKSKSFGDVFDRDHYYLNPCDYTSTFHTKVSVREHYSLYVMCIGASFLL